MKFLMYSKNSCPQCDAAKKQIEAFAEKYLRDYHGPILDVTYVRETGFTKEDLIEFFKSQGLPAPRTVPQIFFREDEGDELELIGGQGELGSFLEKLKGRFDAGNETE